MAAISSLVLHKSQTYPQVPDLTKTHPPHPTSHLAGKAFHAVRALRMPAIPPDRLSQFDTPRSALSREIYARVGNLMAMAKMRDHVGDELVRDLRSNSQPLRFMIRDLHHRVCQWNPSHKQDKKMKRAWMEFHRVVTGPKKDINSVLASTPLKFEHLEKQYKKAPTRDPNIQLGCFEDMGLCPVSVDAKNRSSNEITWPELRQLSEQFRRLKAAIHISAVDPDVVRWIDRDLRFILSRKESRDVVLKCLAELDRLNIQLSIVPGDFFYVEHRAHKDKITIFYGTKEYTCVHEVPDYDKISLFKASVFPLFHEFSHVLEFLEKPLEFEKNLMAPAPEPHYTNWEEARAIAVENTLSRACNVPERRYHAVGIQPGDAPRVVHEKSTRLGTDRLRVQNRGYFGPAISPVTAPGPKNTSQKSSPAVHAGEEIRIMLPALEDISRHNQTKDRLPPNTERPRTPHELIYGGTIKTTMLPDPDDEKRIV